MIDFSLKRQQLSQQGLLRYRPTIDSGQQPNLIIDGKSYLAFCSNDYLGLAMHPLLIQALQQSAQYYGVGAGASALVSGHSQEHEHLEMELAAFVGMERALYFSTGYMANLGVIPALLTAGDTVFIDRLNHACLIDAARLSGAQLKVYPHADVNRLERLLVSCSSTNKLIATDAVFSMDGDIAPLPELLALCERYDAYLLVDDAHGFGILGAQGRGSLSHFSLTSERIIYMGTLGKAAGVYGAFVAASNDLIEWLMQRARTYLFTTASPAALANALRTSLKLVEQETWRRDHLQCLIKQLREGLSEMGWQLKTSDTAIQPLILGDNHQALALMNYLKSQGIWVPAIRPPTVPRGSARLRISLSAAHDKNQVKQLIAALAGFDVKSKYP